MLVLINCSFDGDTYALFNKMENAMDAFKASCESGFYHRVYLVKPNSIGEEFGFGSRGDIFGAEVIEEFDLEEAE
jgi:hypothetical protein